MTQSQAGPPGAGAVSAPRATEQQPLWASKEGLGESDPAGRGLGDSPGLLWSPHPSAVCSAHPWLPAPRATCGLGHLDQASSEHTLQPGLHVEVLGPTCHRDEEVGDIQAPVLGHEVVDHAGGGVLGEADVLQGSQRTAEDTLGQRWTAEPQREPRGRV